MNCYHLTIAGLVQINFMVVIFPHPFVVFVVEILLYPNKNLFFLPHKGRCIVFLVLVEDRDRFIEMIGSSE